LSIRFTDNSEVAYFLSHPVLFTRWIWSHDSALSHVQKLRRASAFGKVRISCCAASAILFTKTRTELMNKGSDAVRKH